MRWLNLRIQILPEVVILLIRLKVVKVKTLASLASGFPWDWARSSLQIFLSIEYCSAYFRFGSFLLRRFFGLSQCRLRLYFGSSSTGLSVLISCSWLLRLCPITFSVSLDWRDLKHCDRVRLFNTKKRFGSKVQLDFNVIIGDHIWAIQLWQQIRIEN